MPDEERGQETAPVIDPSNINYGDEEKCASIGHCHCIQGGAYTCCWCGYFDPEKAKISRLHHLETQVKYVIDKYPIEAKEVLRKYL